MKAEEVIEELTGFKVHQPDPKERYRALLKERKLSRAFEVSPCDDLKVIVGLDTYEVGGLGMIGLISGIEKSMKSTLLKTIVASGLSGEEVLCFKLELNGKQVVSFDTEQSAYNAKKGYTQTLDLAGIVDDSNRFHCYTLKDLAAIEDRIGTIECAIFDTENLGLIVIDGALDLVNSMNEVAEATTVINKIQYWTATTGAMLLMVIHENKGNKNNTGHLGAYLSRKCDFNIQTVHYKESGNTEVKSKLSRTKPFPTFEFCLDGRGYPVLVQNGKIVKPAEHPDIRTESTKADPFAAPFEPNGNVITRPARMNDDESVPF